MKRLIPLLFFFFSFPLFSQSAASSTIKARAMVVEPIQITKTVDMNFGNVIGGYSSGSLILTPEGTRIANGVQISNAVPGEVNPAQALVTHGNHKYSISLPTSFTLYNEENPNQVLFIDQFTVKPFPASQAEASDLLSIGATLNLQANQMPGFYTNSTGFNVTVSYN